MISKLKWYIKQIFPLTYTTHYKFKDENHFVVWKMWMGKSYKIQDQIIQ